MKIWAKKMGERNENSKKKKLTEKTKKCINKINSGKWRKKLTWKCLRKRKKFPKKSLGIFFLKCLKKLFEKISGNHNTKVE